MKGTPKSLNEAIFNGLEAAGVSPHTADKLRPMLRAHVMDFLNQRIGVLTLDDDQKIVDAANRLTALIKGET